MKNWWNDETGLSLADIDRLEKRIGARLWDKVIHLGGISTGTWRPWCGWEGDEVREILNQYESREEFRRHE